jgi:hypothetical protein
VKAEEKIPQPLFVLGELGRSLPFEVCCRQQTNADSESAMNSCSPKFSKAGATPKLTSGFDIMRKAEGLKCTLCGLTNCFNSGYV